MAKGTRDYAKKTTHAKRRRPAKKAKSGSVRRLLWVTPILIVGFAAGLIYLNQLTPTEADKPRLVRQHEAKPQAKPHKPRFEFYTILPKKHMASPSTVTRHDAEATKHYMLQVAAFKSFSEADRLRAELILLGFNANVQQIINQGTTWNRVRLGPYASLAKAENEQGRLKKSHYKSILRQVN